MAREKRAIWLRRLERWGESGLTAREFALKEGVNAGTLASWKYKVAAEVRDNGQGTATPQRVEFVEVCGVGAVAASEERLEVVCLGGRTVRVPTSFNAETLARLLDVLEGR